MLSIFAGDKYHSTLSPVIRIINHAKTASLLCYKHCSIKSAKHCPCESFVLYKKVLSLETLCSENFFSFSFCMHATTRTRSVTLNPLFVQNLIFILLEQRHMSSSFFSWDDGTSMLHYCWHNLIVHKTLFSHVFLLCACHVTFREMRPGRHRCPSDEVIHICLTLEKDNKWAIYVISQINEWDVINYDMCIPDIIPR